ncbi:MAG: DUF4114 domain-containing protein, partial [Merismopedia sp. SIO2A8]|nr:DUF4114 domain-containing protein [Merismopedia sp. SIO2A8]
VLDPNTNPSSATQTRQLNLAEGTFVRFYQLEGSTTDTIQLGQTTLTDVSLEVNSSTNVETLNFGDISLTVESTTETAPKGTTFQGSTQGEILDFRDQDSLLANFTVTSSAAFNNSVGLYTVQNEQGTVIDPLTNQLINPGEAGYAEAAIRIGQNLLEASRDETGSVQLGGAIYAPFIIADGTTEQFLSNNPNNQGEGEEAPLAYFAYLGANPDGVDHVRLLGDNLFGFEDLFSGGDQDYNDIILDINIV